MPNATKGTHLARDSESRKSTAISEKSAVTPQQDKMQPKRGTSAERTQRLVKEASKEAIVLSLDPNAAKKKKKKPRNLEPLHQDDTAKPKVYPKISGNYAHEVLQELADREKNNERATAVRKLDREMKGYLKELNSINDIGEEISKLNDAFDG